MIGRVAPEERSDFGQAVQAAEKEIIERLEKAEAELNEFISAAKIERELGWRPTMDFESGLEAAQYQVALKQVEALLNEMVTSVTKHLKKGARIRIPALGVLVVRKRAARMGRNPATGEPVQIKASKKVAFRAAKELKESI